VISIEEFIRHEVPRLIRPQIEEQFASSDNLEQTRESISTSMVELIRQAIDTSISTYKSKSVSCSSKEGTSGPSGRNSALLTPTEDLISEEQLELGNSNLLPPSDNSQLSADECSAHHPAIQTTSNGTSAKADKGKYPATESFDIPKILLPPDNIDGQNQDYCTLQYSAHPDGTSQSLDELLNSQDFDFENAGNVNTSQYFLRDEWDSELSWLAD